MSEFIYSAKNNAFYPVDMKEDYVAAGSWPDDGVEVSRDIFIEFTNTSLSGKIRKPGTDGLPTWGDLPPLTNQERIAQAEAKRQQLLANANSITADWRTELSLGIISDEDKLSLVKWMAYIKELKAVTIADAIENDFTWPTLPA